MLPAEPSDMNSETASPPISGLVELSTIMPLKFDTADQYELLTYRDHIVLPHHTETMDCVRHPSIDDACRIGFARSNPLWQSFEGGTFCSEIETLVLRPEKMESCLGKHQATLSCETDGKMWCEAGNISLNGNAIPTRVLLAPLDWFIIGGPNTPACDQIKAGVYNHLDLSVNFPDSDAAFERSGDTLLIPKRLTGARLDEDIIACDRAFIDNNTLVVGMLGTSHSWYYSYSDHKLAIYEPKSTVMLDTWYDIIIINLCLFCLMHFLSEDGRFSRLTPPLAPKDRLKNPNKLITLVPELVGSAAALAGLYRQKDSGGVFDRLEDTERGVLSAQIQMWCCLAASAAHLAALTVEADRPSKGLKRARAARNLGHEYALLSSIYLQVASGFSDIYRLYITGVASFALFAAGFYRCIETFVAGNFATTRIASVIITAGAGFSFYTIGLYPAIDPILSLSKNAHEASALLLSLALAGSISSLGKGLISNS